MEIKTILWASDGSKESRHALRWAELWATRFRAKVVALSVQETPNLSNLEVPSDLKREISLMDSKLASREVRRLARVKEVLKKKGIDVEVRTATGVPYEEIMKAARSGTADLIAMGKRGLNLWGRMLLGSTTERVLREARVPVLTVRQASGKLAVKKILVPTSFSPTEAVALEWALESARKFDATVVLLHVIEVHKSYDSVKGGIMGRLRESAAGQLRAMREAVPNNKKKGVLLADKIIAFPRAWSGIVSFVRDQRIDLIVMSTHARTGVPKFVLGSVAERVTEQAPCPVITMRP
jgi:nucleotide-binding universal stress UspA family protein